MARDDIARWATAQFGDYFRELWGRLFLARHDILGDS